MPTDREIAAFTVAELGELLPERITAHQINHAHPIPDVSEGTDDELDALEEARDKFRDVFKDLEWECADQFDDGMPYDIVRDYQTGRNIRYWQDTDDWELNYTVIEIVGDTEADARAKMLIYLIENNLLAPTLRAELSKGEVGGNE
jgi:hypothetical protein